MMVWLRPEYILAIFTSLYCSSQLVFSKTYDKFWCTTEEGIHQLSCVDDTALLTDITIIKVYRRTQMCEPDVHFEYLIDCQSYMDTSACEGNRTCSIEISSRDYIQCEDKQYSPTYLFVKYTCTQIHTMCIDTVPIRNTLHGYIVSPAYPHPMADNLKCSITIEADPSMYIELSPVEITLQDAIKCRGEYIEIFGYDLSTNENSIDKYNNWKEYHTWCGADHSLNNPLPNARYLISSHSLYISLQTATSRTPRYFKIRYKIVPIIARSQYNADGIAFDLPMRGYASSSIALTTSVMATNIIKTSLNNSDTQTMNKQPTKRKLRKGILIGIIALAIVLLIAIATGVFLFVFMKRRRSLSSATNRKKTTPSTTNNTASKTTVKSPDKAPLIEKPINTSTTVAKQKLVPERTLQMSDISTSRFKSNESSSTKPGAVKHETSGSKPPLSAVDSGIYGIDFTESTTTPPTKPTSLAISESLNIQKNDNEPVTVAEPEPVVVVVNPIGEDSTKPPVLPSIDIDTNATSTHDNEERQTLLDTTVQSAYAHLVDMVTSESDGTLCGSALHSRRASNTKQPLVIQEANNVETIILPEITQIPPHHPIPFNPLHVILQKDANKYYTTEYI